MSQFYEKLTTTIPELEIRVDEPMSRHTTFRIGGPADYFVCPDREQIAEVFRIAHTYEIPVTVIGNGSNLLVGDKGIRGLVVEIGSAMNQITVENNPRSLQKLRRKNSAGWNLLQESREVSGVQ